MEETSFRKQGLNRIKSNTISYEHLCDEYSISPREREVISLLLEGKNTRTITDLLAISYNTLKTHLRNIYNKTGTGSQTELILFIWKNTDERQFHYGTKH